jgi:type II restriction enzyme
VQWLLATLGRQLGCRVWVAANDHAREWQGAALGALSIDRLPPLALDPEAERLVALIDVVWLKGTNQVAAAFEVERTTAVHSGLLRMADLAALSPNLSFPLYVVTPRARLDRVRRELSRPTFQLMELHRRCGFFAEEELIDGAAGIMKWGAGPSAIGRLAQWVADVERAD